MRAVLVEDQDLAVLDVAHIVRADDVERAGLGREDRAAVELAEHQRADAERVARADQLLVGQADERIGAFELAQPLDETVDEAVALRARDQMQDHLGVGGRLHHGAFAHQLAAQRQAVGEVAVVADGEAAGIEFGEQRLHVAQNGLAGGRIAHMADGGVAGQAIDHFAPGEGVADEAEAALGVETLAVEADDAGGFLAAMLERVQAERGDRGGVGMAEDAEHAALLAQPVVVGIAEGGSVMVIGSRSFQCSIPFVSSNCCIPPGSNGHNPVRAIRQVCEFACRSDGASGVSVSSGLGRFNLFKMVLSGSSGNMDISHCPVPARTTRDFALFTHSGWLRSGTSQVKNKNATTTMTKPRASPNKKPSVRSSAPTRLSSTMSEIRTVRIETTMRVPRKTPPTTATVATTSLLKYCRA